MAKANKKIPNIVFLKNESDLFEFDIFTIESLFSRADNLPLEKIHRIHFYLLLFIIEGKGEHFIDFSKVKYESKDLIFIAEKQIHKFKVNPNAKGFATLFTKDFLYQTNSEQDILQNYQIFDFSLKRPKLSLDKTHFYHYKQLFEQLYFEHNIKDNSRFKKQIIHSLLKTILLKSEQQIKNSSANEKNEIYYKDFLKFKLCVDANFAKTRNVKNYGRLLGLSTKKLNQLTKETINQTAKEFIDERITLEAKRLLAYTTLSVNEISTKVGFDETTNFIKYFKKHTKSTPNRFRIKQ